MAFLVQQKDIPDQSSDISGSFDSPVTAGNIIVLAIGGDKDCGDLTVTSSGVWSKPVHLRSSSTSLYLAFAVAAGGEQTITATLSVSKTFMGEAWIGEYSDDGSGDWEIVAEATNITDETSVASWSTGTTGAASADGIAVAVWSIDTADNLGTSSYSNGYSGRKTMVSQGGTGRGGLWVAEKSIPSGSATESTLSRSGGGTDQMSGAVVVFGRSGGTPEVVPDAIPSAESVSESAVNAGPVDVSPNSIVSTEIFGTPFLNLEISTVGIASGETFGPNTTVSAGIITLGISSEETVSEPLLQNNGLGISGIPSGEALGSAVILAGEIFVRLGDGIESAEFVSNPTVNNYGLGPTGIPTEEGIGSPSISVGPVFITDLGIASEEATGPVTIFNYGLGPTGIPSEETLGEVYSFTLIPNVDPILSEETFGSHSLNLTIYPFGIESEEIFGSTAGDLPPIVQRQIPQNLISRYEIVCVARIPQTSGAPTFMPIDPLPWTSMEYSDELSRPQSLTMTANISSITTGILQRLRTLHHAPTEIHVYRNGLLVFAGPLMAWSVDDADNITINASGLLSYLDMMGVVSDLTYTDIDQFTIVKNLVDHHQNQDYGNFGIITDGVGESGVIRSATFLVKELNSIGKKVLDLSGGSIGFDIDVDPLTRNLNLYHPKKGTDRSVGEDAIVFDSRNITSFKVSCSAAPGDVASEVIGASSLTDGESLFTIVSNEELRSKFGRAVYMQDFSASDQATLDSMAQGALNVRAEVLLVPGPDSRVTPDADLIKYEVGDTVSYMIHSTLGTQGNFRLRKRTVSVASTGEESVTVEFA